MAFVVVVVVVVVVVILTSKRSNLWLCVYVSLSSPLSFSLLSVSIESGLFFFAHV